MHAREHATPAAAGTLAERPLEQLLVYVEKNGLTGSLVFDDGDGESATIDVESGKIAKIRTRSPLYLGSLLYEMGLIDVGDLDTTLAEMAKQRRPHGQILRERGVVSAAELSGALAEQTTRKLAGLFSLGPEARWAWFNGTRMLATWGSDGGPLVSVLPGLWRGLRDARGEGGAEAALSQIGGRTMELSGDGTAGIGLAPDEARLAARLVRPLTLDELVDGAGTAPDLARKLVYVLLLARRIALRAPGEPERKPSDPRLPAAGSRPSFQFRVPAARSSSEPTLPGVPHTSGTRAIPEPPRPSVQLAPDELRARIREKADAAERQDHFEVLEIGAGATVEEARAAYFRLARVFHPDKLPPTLEPERDACTRLFARIDLAFRTLTDTAARAKYVSGVHARTSSPPPRAKPIIEARGALARGDHASVVAACARGLSKDPEDGDLMALAAWARACLVADGPGIEDALLDELAALERAIALAPVSADAHFYRAEINRRLGRPMHALRDYREALERNPHHVDALREMRLFQMRVEKGMSRERALSPADGVAAVRPTSGSAPRRDSVREKLAEWLKK